MRRRELRHGGVRLSYLDPGGTGSAVVLLHGLAGSAGELEPTARALTEHRVLLLDQRGHGHSSRRPLDTSRRAFADDVAAVIDAAGTGPVALVGHSMGAHTALLTAAWHPRLVRRLVLLEGGVGGGDQDLPAAAGRRFASWPMPFPDRQAAVHILGGTPTARAWAADLEATEGGYRPRFDAEVMEAVLASVVERPRWSEWTRVRSPTLLVQASRSSIDVAEVHRMLEMRPATRHAVIDDAGHDAHLDQPKAWAALLRSHLHDDG